MHQEPDHRLSVRPVERERRREEDDRDDEDEREHSAHARPDDERDHERADDPAELPPRERSRDLVLDIDELGYVVHHTLQNQNGKIKMENYGAASRRLLCSDMDRFFALSSRT